VGTSIRRPRGERRVLRRVHLEHWPEDDSRIRIRGRARGALEFETLESGWSSRGLLRRRCGDSFLPGSVRQHAGLMVPGPVQAAVALAYGDDAHVNVQRERYLTRLELLSRALKGLDVDAPMPEGTFYLWCSKEGLDGWALATMLRRTIGSRGQPWRTLRRRRQGLSCVLPSSNRTSDSNSPRRVSNPRRPNSTIDP